MGLPGPPGEKGSTVRHNKQDREVDVSLMKSNILAYEFTRDSLWASSSRKIL